MSKNLLIVESPAKAKTIEKYLGKDYTVKSCYGHIRDLQKENMGIDIENNFEPTYIISADKKHVVDELKKTALKTEQVWLATDEDREGEAISWHLCESLGLDVKNTKRIVFHEITKSAILKAISEPRNVNMDLVNAQQARRVLDRLVGFKLSPLLQRKLNFQIALSAGRVQSVAVKLIVEREREINQFNSQVSYKVRAFLNAPNREKKAIPFFADREDLKNETEATDFLESCKNATFSVENIEVKKGKKSPSAPFTTSTLQQEAAKKMGYSVSRTMSIAQQLYENGYITYMRTDSVNLSQEALTNISEQISRQFGKNYHQFRQYKNKNSNAQEAHEAIRPTNMEVQNIDTFEGKKLYELIWKRTMASQMADAQTEKTHITFNISTRKDTMKSIGEVILFDGFLKLYLETIDEEQTDDQDDKILPPLKIGQLVEHDSIVIKQKYSRPESRYNEAALVKKLEELGIGRPSTYASTINTIIKRNYVEKKEKDAQQRAIKIFTLKHNEVYRTEEQENFGAEKNKLFPTDLGMIITDYLNNHFSDIMNYQFTAEVEENLDKVADGKLNWKKLIGNFYQPFLKSVEINLKDTKKINSERILGTDPKTGLSVLTRMARYGAVVQIGSQEETDKPLFANLKSTQSIETISLDDALELFTLPKQLGDFEDLPIVINIGRFGPYLQHNSKSFSLKKGIDPYQINLSEAIEIIIDKRRLPRLVGQYQQLDVTVNVGRFGPYAAFNSNFYSLKKGMDVYVVSIEEVIKVIDEQEIKKEKNTIKKFPDQQIVIMNGRFGPYIKKEKLVIKIPKEYKNDLENISLEEIEKIIGKEVKIEKPKKNSFKVAADKKTTIIKKVKKKSIKKIIKKTK